MESKKSIEYHQPNGHVPPGLSPHINAQAPPQETSELQAPPSRRRHQKPSAFPSSAQEKLQEGDFEVESLMSFGRSHWCQSTPNIEHRSTDFNQNRSTGSPEHRSTTPAESTASCNVVRIMTHEGFTAKHPHPPIPVYVKIDRHSDPVIDRHKEAAIDQQPPAPIDGRAPLTYRVQMPKIDVARLNALRPQPKPSDNPPEAIRIPSDNAADPMEIDRVPMGRTPEENKGKSGKTSK
ncbi:hypothetical protein DY000_02021365 [Brassica cretica]|uniref:Uncharacterized protein n=1 Tax=Brassica cretica TaxID=69181 RepID=A0ABQ7EFC2_BRACR|nr:hypothetical protein DY000_02021365 [Brassica cretica]